MEIRQTELDGVLVVETRKFADDRGYFVETWQSVRYTDHGIPGPFVQDSLSFSRANVLRGLHMQNPGGQAKLVQAVFGEVFDVAVDLRVGSPTFGKWTGVHLSADNARQFFIPEGFAHGFCVLSEAALFSYKYSALYAPQYEMTIRWDDPDIGIAWPMSAPIVSDKDALGELLRDIDHDRLPGHSG